MSSFTKSFIFCMCFLMTTLLQAQTLQQKSISFNDGIVTSRFGDYYATIYSFSNDGKEFYTMPDRIVDNHFPRNNVDGYTYFDMDEAGGSVAIFEAATGKYLDGYSKYFLVRRNSGRNVQVAFDQKCFLSSDYDCNEKKFEVHRPSFYDRLPQGWVNAAQKIKLNYQPGACMRRHLTTDSTLSICLLNVIDEKTETLAGCIPNIRLFSSEEALRYFNIAFARASFLADDRTLTKKELHNLAAPEIKSTRVTYNAQAQTGYMVLYFCSQSVKESYKTQIKILRFSFKDGSCKEIYSSAIYRNDTYDYNYGKLKIATKDVLTDNYFIHYHKSYKDYVSGKDEPLIDLIKFNNETDSSSVSVYSLTPPAALMNVVEADELGRKSFSMEGVSGDSVVYTYYNNTSTFIKTCYYVDYKRQKLLSVWAINPYKGIEAIGVPDIYFNAALNKMAVVQTYKLNNVGFWNGVQVLDMATEKKANCDRSKSELADAKRDARRVAEEQQELTKAQKARDEEEARIQKLIQDNARLKALLDNSNSKSSNACSMCNGSGKVEKFGTHLARVAYTDSQGRTIYHNVETTTGSYYETCPKCHGSGKN